VPSIAHAFRDRRCALVTAEVLQHVGGDDWTWTAPEIVDGSQAGDLRQEDCVPSAEEQGRRMNA
jgi:hypothetical protein